MNGRTPAPQPDHCLMGNALCRCPYQNRDLPRQGPQRRPYLFGRDAGIGARRPRVSFEISLTFFVGREQISVSNRSHNASRAEEFSAQTACTGIPARPSTDARAHRTAPTLYPSWPGSSRPSTSCCHPQKKTWMPGTSPGMTSELVRGYYAGTTSSLMTRNFVRSIRPKLVVSATSAASRPVPIRMRPIRGWLWRASNVYHWPER